MATGPWDKFSSTASDTPPAGPWEKFGGTATPEPPPKEASVLDQFTSSFKRAGASTVTGAKALVGSPEKAAQAATEGVARQEEISKETGTTRGFDEVKQAYNEQGIFSAAGEFINQIPGAVAAQSANIAGVLGAGFGGARLGAPFGPAGAVVGGIAGAGTYLYPQMFGQAVEEQASVAQQKGEPVVLNRGPAAVAATVQTALEIGGTAFTVGKNVVLGILGKEIGKDVAKATAKKELLAVAQASLAKGAGKGAARGLVEIPVEIAQQVLTRWQAGQDLLSDDAYSAYGDAAYGAIQVGPALGALASPVERSSARGQLEARGLDPSGEPVDSQTPRDTYELQKEQQTAGYMRGVDQKELEDRNQQAADAQTKLVADFQTNVDAVGTRITEAVIQPDGLTDNLDLLYNAKDNLTSIKDQLTRDASTTDLRRSINTQIQAVNAKIKQGQTLAKQIGVEPARRAQVNKEALANLPPAQRANIAAQTLLGATPQQAEFRDIGGPQVSAPTTRPSQVLTTNELINSGLPKAAAYVKQLSGLDLSEPNQRTQASQILGQVLANNKIAPEVKTNIQALYDTKLAAPVAPTQEALDFNAPMAPVAPTEPTQLTPEIFNSLGIGRTAKLRKNPDITSADLTDPKQRAFIREALEIYRDTTNRAPEIQDKITAFLETIPPIAEQSVGAQDGQSTPPSTAVRSEPIVDRQPSEPSVGVGDVGVEPTTTQADTAGAVPQTEPTGLVGDNSGVTSDDRFAGTAPSAVTEVVKNRVRYPVVTGTMNVRHGYKGSKPPKFVKNYKGYRYEDNSFGNNGVYLDATGKWTSNDPFKMMFSVDNVAEVDAKFTNALLLAPESIGKVVAAINRGKPTMDLATGKLVTGKQVYAWAKRNGFDGIVVDGFDTVMDNITGPIPENYMDDAQTEARVSTKIREAEAWIKSLGIEDTVGQDQIFAFNPEQLSVVKSGIKPGAQATPDVPQAIPDITQATPEAPIAEAPVDPSVINPQNPIEQAIADLQGMLEPTLSQVKGVAARAFKAKRITQEDFWNITTADDVYVAMDDLAIAVENSLSNVAIAAQAARANGTAPGALTNSLQTALNSLSPQAALNAILNDTSGSFNAREQLVAKKILDLGGKLPTMRIADSLGVDAKGMDILGQYNSITDEITLVRDAADSHTFMHELIHSFVHRTIINQEQQGARRPEFRTLNDVYAHVQKVRPDLAKEYGMASLTEFASEAMSNREFQEQLMSIPYPNETSLFSWFARALRGLLGIPEGSKEANVLFISMISVDGLLRTGRQLQQDTTGMRIGEFDVAYAAQNVDTPFGQMTARTIADVNAAADPVYRSEKRKFMNTLTRAQAPLADIFRQQAVDMQAPIARKVNKAFDDGLRTSFGDVNPMVWLRQAYDHDRVAAQVFKKGGLRMDKAGLWEAYALKDAKGNEASATAVVQQINALAKKYDLTYSQMKARVATVFESVRLSGLRAHNAKLEALAQEHVASGDLDKAWETRSEKFALHKTFAEIDADMRVFNDTPELKALQTTMNTVRNNLIDAMALSGRITPAKAIGWKEAVDYIPFTRLQELLENPEIVFTPQRRGIAALGKLPELRGSFERPVANSIDNYMNKLAWMTDQSMRNSAVVRTLDFMVESGTARRLMSKSDADSTHIVLPLKLYKDGIETTYELQNQYDIAAFVQTPELTGTTVKALGGASRLLRATITATPMFAIKQVIDDSQRVVFNSGVKRPLAALGKTLYYFPRVWWAQALGKDFKGMQQLESGGIAGEIDFNPINPAELIEFDAKAVKRSYVRAFVHRMEQIAKASDMAARLAVYEQTLQEGGSAVLAQTRARELINFNRRGASKTMRMLTHVVPFFNSWAQGNDLVYRGLTGQDSSSGLQQKAARKMFISRIVIMAGLSTIYSMSMSDDDDYNEQTDRTRDHNWILPKFIRVGLGLDQPLKISVPNEFGFMFKSIPERVVQYLKESSTGEQRDAYSMLMGTVKDVAGEFGMMPIPAAIKPVFENMVNFSMFTRRELIPPSMKDRPAPLQYTSGTSELGKAIGKVTNTSPILIDNAIRGYFGIAGGAVSTVADILMNPNRPSVALEKIPFLSIGLLAPVGTRTKDEFYDFREKVAQAVNGASFLKDKPQERAAFIEKNGYLLSAAPYVNNKLKALAHFREVRRFYENDPRFNPQQKREEITKLKKQEQEILMDLRKFRAQTMARKP